MPDRNSLNDYTKSLQSGIPMTLATPVTLPADKIKNFQQTRGLSVLDAARDIFHSAHPPIPVNRLLSFYDGLIAHASRGFARGILNVNLLVHIPKYIAQLSPALQNHHHKPNTQASLVAAPVMGFIETLLFSNFAEVARIQRQQGASYSEIFRNPRCFTQGFTYTWARNSITLGSVACARSLLLKPDSNTLSNTEKVTAAIITAAVKVPSTATIDILKTNAQSVKSTFHERAWHDIIIHIARNQGVTALFRGSGPRTVIVICNTLAKTVGMELLMAK
mgnify:CR=1 FL=1